VREKSANIRSCMIARARKCNRPTPFAYTKLYNESSNNNAHATYLWSGGYINGGGCVRYGTGHSIHVQCDCHTHHLHHRVCDPQVLHRQRILRIEFPCRQHDRDHHKHLIELHHCSFASFASYLNVYVCIYVRVCLSFFFLSCALDRQ
jgi:hypothetical protein